MSKASLLHLSEEEQSSALVAAGLLRISLDIEDTSIVVITQEQAITKVSA